MPTPLRPAAVLTAALALLAVFTSGCFAPVGEVLAPSGTDAGLVASDAGPSTDAGSEPDPPPAYRGLHAASCGPADGPATQFLLDLKGVTCPASSAALDVELYTGDLSPRTVTFLGGVGGQAFASLCGALECFAVQSGVFTITSSTTGVVRGAFDLTFANGEQRQGTFETQLCGADAGMPPPLCG